MSSRSTKSPAKEKKEIQNGLLKLAETIVLYMSRGNFVVSSQKEVGKDECKSSLSPKTISGILTTLKKSPLFDGAFKNQKAVNQKGSKSSLADIDAEALNMKGCLSEMDVRDLQRETVYIPALGLSASLKSLTIYLRGVLMQVEGFSEGKARTASRAFANYVSGLMRDESPHVITQAGLRWDSQTHKVYYEGDVSVDNSLTNADNVSSQQDGDKLSEHGKRIAHSLYERMLRAFSSVKEQDESVSWTEVDYAQGEMARLFQNTTRVPLADFTDKTSHTYAKAPTAVHKIVHDNFMQLLLDTGAVTSISVANVPESLTVSEADKELGTLDRYKFGDMNEMTDVIRVMKHFKLKFDGVASVGDSKTSTSKKTAAERVDPVTYILERYLDAAGLLKTDDDSADKLAGILDGSHCMEVTSDFTKSNGASGFRRTKMQNGKKHSPVFSGSHLMDLDAAVRALQTLQEQNARGHRDEDFWTTFIELLRATIKVPAVRENKKDGTQSQTAQERTREFFEFLHQYGGEHVSVGAIMRDYVTATRTAGSSVTTNEM